MSSDPLRRAIERLVSPHREPFLQRIGSETRVTLVTHPGLLQQLRAAVVGGTGAHPGGASGGLDSSRLPFDAEASNLLATIERTLATWIAAHDARPFPGEPETTLVAWYRLHAVAYLAGRITPEAHGRHVRWCLDWAERIEAMFNPPERVPLGAPCPACGSRWALKPDGEQIDALQVEYQRDGHAIGDIRAVCRVPTCAAVWTGRDGIEDLMDAIGVAERRLEEHLARALADSPDTGPIPLPA